jgi:hypothetical protein
MVRTVISLDAEEKAWLDRRAAEEGVPMTQVVRDAIRRLREESEARPGFDALLGETRGIWTAGDGLEYQKRLRTEWGGAG